ncbi:MAG: extracellular solute-binding protein [Hydrogenoanaerobacterium sp.]
MKKRLLSLLCLTLVAAMLLTACGAPAASSAAPAAPAESKASEAAPAEPAKTGEKAELVYWTMWNETEPQGKVLGEAIDAYSKKTGVKVEVQYNGRDIRKTLQPALDNGTVIDIFDEDVERVNGTWGNYLLDLEEMAAKSYEATGGKPFTDVVSKTLINLARSLGPNGKLSTIPYQPSTFVVMYNKEIFEAAGIKEMPKTWDEFLAVCEKIKAAGKTPITVDDAYIGALTGYHLDRIIGKDATVALSTSKSWDNPGVLKFAQDWENMAKKGYISAKAAANVFPQGQLEEIATESTAMYLNGTWLPNEIKDTAKPDFKWGSFAYPAVAPEGDGPEANNFGAQCIGINKATKYPQEAFDLIVWLTTGEWDNKLAAESMGVPMGNDSTWPVQLADAKVVLDSTKTRLPWACGMETDADVHARVKENFQKLISGTIDANGYVKAMKG